MRPLSSGGIGWVGREAPVFFRVFFLVFLRPASGVLGRRPFGVWRPASGVWRLASGIQCPAFWEEYGMEAWGVFLGWWFGVWAGWALSGF